MATITTDRLCREVLTALSSSFEGRQFAEGTTIASRAGWPAPDPGEDSVAILGDLGYSEAEIDLMLKMKVVSGRVPLFNK